MWEFLPEGETPSLTREYWRDPQGPRMYTKPLTPETAPEGPDLSAGSRGSD